MVRTPFSSPFVRLVAAFVLLFSVGSALFAPAFGQSAEQLDMFRTLPPEQQRAILDAMQREGESGLTYSDRPLDFPEFVRPRKEDKELEEEGYELIGGQLVRKEPRLKANDTVLLHLEIMQFEEQRQAPPSTTRPAPLPTLQPGSLSPSMDQQAMPAQQQVAPESKERIVRSEEEEQRLRALRDQVQRRNPYRLDKWGILNVPELGPIPLAGLTVQEAIQRLSAERSFREFIVHLTRLPLAPIGSDALKPFGYELFAGIPSTFAPATDVPVPAEYVLGPGDTIQVQLFGNTKGRYSLVVGRDGRIDFPELGPIAVSGRRFMEVREDLESRVRDQMIGTQASVSIGELRSIRVFVLGEAESPGSYTVSGLSTITNALLVSGGVKDIGSLRKIQLKRAGQTVTTLDLYDLLLRGDTRADLRLLPGDVIFIPPVGTTVSIAGEVRRPAIYELKTESTVDDLLELAGGLTPSADPKVVTLERITDNRQRVTLDIDLSTSSGQNALLRSGDILRVSAIRPVLENSVTISGHVYRPGQFQFREGMRLTDVIGTLEELKPNADHHYVLIRRELPPDRKLTVFSADLGRALEQPSSAANLELAPRDEIFVFDLESGRERIIEPLMRELRLQSQIDQPTSEISISGQVKVPGRYPLEPGMRLTDLLRAGGGLSEAAYGGQAEVTRYVIGDDDAREAELIEIDLRAALSGDPRADIPLRSFDQVVIKEVPLWDAIEEVEVSGEVRFPGRYPIKRGETLSSLLRRAGGLTDFAFSEGAVFTRAGLKDRERKQLEALATRMQSDLAQLSLHAAQEGDRDAGEALAVGQSLLTSLRETEPVGRLVINLDRSMTAAANSEHDVVLKDGDRLLVPRVTQEVTVIGEVQSITSHLYSPDRTRDDYIAMSGGLTPRADEDRIYVVRANGSVEVRSSSAWFSSGNVEIRPGDTIVVPLDTERMRPLPFWTAVTTIIYNLAVSVAAVNSFN